MMPVATMIVSAEFSLKTAKTRYNKHGWNTMCRSAGTVKLAESTLPPPGIRPLAYRSTAPKGASCWLATCFFSRASGAPTCRAATWKRCCTASEQSCSPCPTKQSFILVMATLPRCGTRKSTTRSFDWAGILHEDVVDRFERPAP